MRIRVLRKEKITVPAGTFNAIVVQPVIKTTGIFSENGQALIWLSDDDRKIMLQLKSKVSFGSLNLYLKSYFQTGRRNNERHHETRGALLSGENAPLVLLDVRFGPAVFQALCRIRADHANAEIEKSADDQ